MSRMRGKKERGGDGYPEIVPLYATLSMTMAAAAVISGGRGCVWKHQRMARFGFHFFGFDRSRLYHYLAGLDWARLSNDWQHFGPGAENI
jgi:hypothetical protein